MQILVMKGKIVVGFFIVLEVGTSAKIAATAAL